jgi:hypothetical protein
MDRNSIAKLRQGQTIYYASRSGWVQESFVKARPEMLDGYPMVPTDTRFIFSEGRDVTNMETVDLSVWHLPDAQFREEDFLTTRSRKRALRWAKEGFARTQGIVHYKEPVWTPEMGERLQELTAELN